MKYLWIKYKYRTKRIVNDHREYEWNVIGAKKLLKKIYKTSDVAQPRPQSNF